MEKDVRRALLIARGKYATAGEVQSEDYQPFNYLPPPTPVAAPASSANTASNTTSGKTSSPTSQKKVPDDLAAKYAGLFGENAGDPPSTLPIQEPLPAVTVNYPNLMPPGMGMITPASAPGGGLPNVPGFMAGPSGFGSLVPAQASLTAPFSGVTGAPNLGAPTPSVGASGGFNPSLAQAMFNAPAAAVPKLIEPTTNPSAPSATTAADAAAKNVYEPIEGSGTTSESDGPGSEESRGGSVGFASGGHVGHVHVMDPHDLPGIHVRTAHTFAAGGTADNPDEGEGFDAYHGSPHAFEKFDLGKIGTGEGAQAYGHGMYFAENEGIARSYRRMLSKGPPGRTTTILAGKPVEDLFPDAPSTVKALIAGGLIGNEGDVDRTLHNWKSRGTPLSMMAHERLAPYAGQKAELPPEPGHLYHVRIKANPEHFLDWDAPLSEQHPKVREALENFHGETSGYHSEKLHPSLTGEQLYRGAAIKFGRTIEENAPKVAQALHAAGIPGIKYWDAGSRAQGQGTRNYVIFNPDIIHVKRRYADGGLIQDKYPTHYMPNVGRQVMADGGDPGSDPMVQKAMDVAQQTQPSPVEGAMGVARAIAKPGARRFEIAPPRGAVPAAMSAKAQNLTEPGSVNIKSLAEAFKRAIDNHLSLPPAEQMANSRQAENNVAKFVGRGKTGKINSVLTANKKLMKAQTAGEGETPLTLPDGRTIEMTGLSLMPDYREGQFRVCGNSGVCRDLCLGKESGQYRFDPTATQAEMPTTKEQMAEAAGKPRMAALKRTIAMLRDPESFAVYLHELIDGAQQQAERRGSHLGVRLNVLSDLSPKILEPIIKANPRVSFYDYTKMNYDPVASNHHYTYSSTGLSQSERGVENPFSNWRQMRERLNQGHNVAMAFAHGKSDAFPHTIHDEETGHQYRVVSGDEHDFRPMDMVPEGERGVIIALKNMAASNSDYKYKNAARGSHGFFIHHEPDFEKTKAGTFAKDENGNRIPRNTVYTVPVQPQKRGTAAPPQGGETQ